MVDSLAGTARSAAVMLGVLAVGVTTGLVLKDRSARKPA
jgi:hypothetical protein